MQCVVLKFHFFTKNTIFKRTHFKRKKKEFLLNLKQRNLRVFFLTYHGRTKVKKVFSLAKIYRNPLVIEFEYFVKLNLIRFLAKLVSNI